MKRKNNEFSVLMSVYKNDKKEHVRMAIDSILNQTMCPNQFVIMIDGPVNDDLKNLLQSYDQNKIVELHFRENNLGLGKTLNEGLNYCRYDIVARMDADDYSMPNRFEKEIKYLLEHKEISIVGSYIKEFKNDIDDTNYIRGVPESNEDIIRFAKKRNPFNHPSVAFRKADVLSVGSYKDVRFLQDYYLWVDMILHGYKGYNFQEPLVCMRADNNLFKRRSGRNYIKIQKQLLLYMKNNGFINNFQYYCSLIIRTCSGYAPNWLRQFAFKKIMRKRVIT